MHRRFSISCEPVSQEKRSTYEDAHAGGERYLLSARYHGTRVFEIMLPWNLVPSYVLVALGAIEANSEGIELAADMWREQEERDTTTA